jgi:succinate-semialdehyde dehydrogenase / glutarate-semialdehyde dehydrogenase
LEAVSEANRLPYGLAAYAYTHSPTTAAAVAAEFESGTVSISHHGLVPSRNPARRRQGKDSGYGSEGGAEAIAAYLVIVTQTGL